MGTLRATSTASGPIRSVNPATGELLGEVPDQGVAEVRVAVEKARAAQSAFAGLGLRRRGEALLGLRDAILRRADDLCDLLARENGKTRVEALTMEVTVVADLIHYFGRRLHKLLAPEPIELHLLKNRASYLHYVPRGVVGVIAPWNFPFGIPMGEVAMAMLAGNGVVLKPSEATPLIALLAKEIHDASGLPRDLFQVVTGRGPTGAALIDAGIDQCIFTGSTATGRKVAAACGERLIPCTLELGGKAPAVVCADADLPRTARAIAWGGFANSGQVCVSVERVYAHESVYDELVQRLGDEVRGLRQGDPRSEVDVGVMTWEPQLEVVEARIRQAVEAGARVVSGGARRDGGSLFFPPTILADCTQEMDVMRRETFGPVVPVMKVPDEEEALRLANDSHLGLMAYVFTRDTQKGKRLAERLASGMVMVNDCLIAYGAPETPWGGIKQSGIGRTHSVRGLKDLCEERHVNYDRLTLPRELWWYPYSDRFYRGWLRALRWVMR